jgi:cyclase
VVKKRLIFTLLYQKGAFMLSRNFRLQRVGDVRWLTKNYNFSRIATSIDELIILDVSREESDQEAFLRAAGEVCRDCFMPLALGGGIRTREHADRLIASGADKVVVNTILHHEPGLVRELVRTYGSQAVVGSLDFRCRGPVYTVYAHRGQSAVEGDLLEIVKRIEDLGVGEVYLNSIDRDGTGQGYWEEAAELVGHGCSVPLILAGGAGNARHLKQGLDHLRVDAVATANLFNFVGEGLPQARAELLVMGAPLARWSGRASIFP